MSGEPGETVEKKRILFVDDQPNVLSGLRRMLRSKRDDWEMAFVESGEAALAALAEAPFDVLVTDMRMPGMDGARLLELASQRHPHLARIVLSGQTELQQFLRTVGPAHQFLSKPCEAEVLRDAISSVSAIQELIPQAELKALVVRIQALPTRSETFHALQAELQSKEGSVMRVGELVGQDLGLTAKVVQLVNSAYFGIRQKVTDPRRAVMLLGLDFVRTLVLATRIFSQFESVADGALSLEALWRHSAAVASHTKTIAELEGFDQELAGQAFLSGMLHDLGKLALADQMPEAYCRARALAREAGLTEHAAEREVFGATHAEVGGFLAGLWGLPYIAVECLFHHHEPSLSPSRANEVLAVVHAANVFEHELSSGSGAELDERFLERVGLLERASGAWREACVVRSEERG